MPANEIGNVWAADLLFPFQQHGAIARQPAIHLQMHAKHGAAGRRGRINRLREDEEADSGLPDCLEHLDQVLNDHTAIMSISRRTAS